MDAKLNLFKEDTAKCQDFIAGNKRADRKIGVREREQDEGRGR